MPIPTLTLRPPAFRSAARWINCTVIPCWKASETESLSGRVRSARALAPCPTVVRRSHQTDPKQSVEVRRDALRNPPSAQDHESASECKYPWCRLLEIVLLVPGNR